MLTFPQLTTGANVQYPLKRTAEYRTVINALEDGTEVKFSDTAAPRTSWELRLASITEVERQAVESLFVAVAGELNTFTLLDPASNLLAWSEDFTRSQWTVDPLLQTAGGQADPKGGVAAWSLTNSGQAQQQVAQAIAGPPNFLYCFSVYVKGAGVPVTLSLSTGLSRTFTATSQWARISVAGVPGGSSVSAAIALPAGGSLQVFGPQLEAQPAAGPYRRSLGTSGVYSKVRFASPTLSATAIGLDRNAATIRLVSVD